MLVTDLEKLLGGPVEKLYTVGINQRPTLSINRYQRGYPKNLLLEAIKILFNATTKTLNKKLDSQIPSHFNKKH